MTPDQCRAARGLLHWTQTDLAREADVGQSTVADFERGARATEHDVIRAMADAFGRAGVVILADGVMHPKYGGVVFQ